MERRRNSKKVLIGELKRHVALGSLLSLSQMDGPFQALAGRRTGTTDSVIDYFFFRS